MKLKTIQALFLINCLGKSNKIYYYCSLLINVYLRDFVSHLLTLTLTTQFNIKLDRAINL